MGSPTQPPLSDDEKRARLRLIRSENVGPVTFKHLLRRFGSGEAALAALPDLARRGGRNRTLRIASTESVETELANAAKIGATVLHLDDAAYPASLRHIDDAPALLYAIGDLSLLERPSFAVVGGRNASVAGRTFAKRIASEIGATGRTIVSGLARGIDTAAHTGALETGTAAVLAGGVDVLFPPENEALYQALRETGLLLSEMPPETKPLARHFPRRNRIISGLSDALLVIEAKRKSGSLITARCAADQGRLVFAAPASPLEPRGQGCNDLIRDGATLVQDAEEILAELAPSSPVLREAAAPVPTPAAAAEDGSVDSARAYLVRCLSGTPMPVDDVIRDSGLPPSAVLSALVEMELAGGLLRHSGGAVSAAPAG